LTTINTILSRLQAININNEAVTAIEATKDEIVALNRERMLSGKLSDGSAMPPYSKISVSVYGYPPGPWRLKNTGSFQEKIKVNVNSVSFISTSTDDKTAMLIKKVNDKGLDGEAIFGLDKEGKKEYVNDLRPVFVKQVRNKLSL